MSNPKWITAGDWKIGEQIGKGAFGEVYKGLSGKGLIFAVKKMNMRNKASEIDNLMREIELMARLVHENIVSYFGSYVDTASSNVYIFQQWVAGGSIEGLLKQYGPLSLSTVRNYLFQILKGVKYLHDNNVVHRDIKGGNVLVDVNVVKLADFGASTSFASFENTQETTAIHGTPYFMAPEVLANSKYGRKGDIWAVGCTMIQMLTAKSPWSDRKLSGIVQLHVLLASWVGPPPCSVELPPDAREFLENCCKKNETERLSAAELLSTAFIINDDNADAKDDEVDTLSQTAAFRGLKLEMEKAAANTTPVTSAAGSFSPAGAAVGVNQAVTPSSNASSGVPVVKGFDNANNPYATKPAVASPAPTTMVPVLPINKNTTATNPYASNSGGSALTGPPVSARQSLVPTIAEPLVAAVQPPHSSRHTKADTDDQHEDNDVKPGYSARRGVSDYPDEYHQQHRNGLSIAGGKSPRRFSGDENSEEDTADAKANAVRNNRSHRDHGSDYEQDDFEEDTVNNHRSDHVSRSHDRKHDTDDEDYYNSAVTHHRRSDSALSSPSRSREHPSRAAINDSNDSSDDQEPTTYSRYSRNTHSDTRSDRRRFNDDETDEDDYDRNKRSPARRSRHDNDYDDLDATNTTSYGPSGRRPGSGGAVGVVRVQQTATRTTTMSSPHMHADYGDFNGESTSHIQPAGTRSSRTSVRTGGSSSSSGRAGAVSTSYSSSSPHTAASAATAHMDTRVLANAVATAADTEYAGGTWTCSHCGCENTEPAYCEMCAALRKTDAPPTIRSHPRPPRTSIDRPSRTSNAGSSSSSSAASSGGVNSSRSTQSGNNAVADGSDSLWTCKCGKTNSNPLYCEFCAATRHKGINLTH